MMIMMTMMMMMTMNSKFKTVWGALVVKHSRMFMIHPHQPGGKTSLNPLNLLLTFLDSRRVPKKQGALANPRTVLRNKLRVKQFQAGNGWLAR